MNKYSAGRSLMSELWKWKVLHASDVWSRKVLNSACMSNCLNVCFVGVSISTVQCLGKKLMWQKQCFCFIDSLGVKC